MKLLLVKVSQETNQLLLLNKDIDLQKLAGLLIDEWASQNLRAKTPLPTTS